MKKPEYPYSYEQLQSSVIDKLREIGHPERIPNWGMIGGGAESGGTWRRNYESYQAIGFRQRLIHEAYDPDLSCKMLGRPLAMPIAVAPMAAAAYLAHEDPFLEIAKACHQCGIAAGIGFPSGKVQGRDMTAICKNSFRIIKPHMNEQILFEELQQSQADGCMAVGIDLDSLAGLKTGDDAGHFGDFTKAYDKELLKEVRKSVSVPFILKGIMSIQDAEAAMEIGADALVVSTHAGYGLDCGYSPLEVLSGIRNVVGPSIELYVDSGIRRGTDVLKALAMGANCVWIGRLMIWGLLLDGANGIAWIIHLLEQEMVRTMRLIGAACCTELDQTCLVPLNDMGSRMLRV